MRSVRRLGWHLLFSLAIGFGLLGCHHCPGAPAAPAGIGDNAALFYWPAFVFIPVVPPDAPADTDIIGVPPRALEMSPAELVADAELAEFVERYRTSVEYLRRGAERRRCAFGDADLSLFRARLLANGAVTFARLREGRGDGPAAARIHLDVIRLGARISTDGTIIRFMIGAAVADIGQRSLAAMLVRDVEAPVARLVLAELPELAAAFDVDGLLAAALGPQGELFPGGGLPDREDWRRLSPKGKQRVRRIGWYEQRKNAVSRLLAAAALARAERGAYPETLEELRPYFPGGLPLDPATREDFTYRLENGRPVVEREAAPGWDLPARLMPGAARRIGGEID